MNTNNMDKSHFAHNDNKIKKNCGFNNTTNVFKELRTDKVHRTAGVGISGAALGGSF